MPFRIMISLGFKEQGSNSNSGEGKEMVAERLLCCAECASKLKWCECVPRCCYCSFPNSDSVRCKTGISGSESLHNQRNPDTLHGLWQCFPPWQRHGPTVNERGLITGNSARAIGLPH